MWRGEKRVRKRHVERGREGKRKVRLSSLGGGGCKLAALLSPDRLTGRFMNPSDGELWPGSADLVANVTSG